MRFRFTVALILLTASFGSLACDTTKSASKSESETEKSSASANDEQQTDQGSEQTPKDPSGSDEKNQKPAESSPEQPEGKRDLPTMTSFGTKLLKQTSTGESENTVLSPYSMGAALGMMSAGAKGKTRKQLLDALGVDGDVTKQFATLRSTFPTSSDGEESKSESDETNFGRLRRPKGSTSTFNTANALWLRQGFQPRSSYVDALRTGFGAAVDSLDFGSASKAADRINQWVAKNTEDKITDLVSPGMFDRRTRLVLTNSVYFKGSWQVPFEESKTESDTFRTAAGDDVEVPMMQRTAEMAYFEAEDAPVRGVQLRYAGNQFVFHVLVPEQGHYETTASDLDAQRLRNWMDYTLERVEVRLPKFNTRFKFRAEKALNALGITHAFSPQQADFSGIHDNEQLYVDAIVHEAHLSVDEQGTEAAAASAGSMRTTGGYLKQKEPTKLHVDRPFLIVLEHEPSETVLFTGWIKDPS